MLLLGQGAGDYILVMFWIKYGSGNVLKEYLYYCDIAEMSCLAEVCAL